MVRTSSFFLVFAAVALFAMPANARAAQSCLCTLNVDGAGCEINDSVVRLPFSKRINPQDILDRVDTSGCNIIDIVSPYFLQPDQFLFVDEGSCTGNTSEGSELGYDYSYQCALSDELPDVEGTEPDVPVAAPADPAAGAAPAAGSAKPAARVKLPNPLTSDNMQTILGSAVATALGVMGSIVLLVFVYGGVLWLTSAGSPERVKKGTQTMLWAAIGVFIIFSSYAILKLVITTVSTLTP